MTIPASGKALVTVTALETGNNGNAISFMSFTVSGASTVAASDSQALVSGGAGGGQSSATYLQAGLTAGTNTFTAKYRGNGSQTSTFANRSIVVIPMP